LESSIDNTFENSPEPKDVEKPSEAYEQDLEFDDFPEDKPEDQQPATQVNAQPATDPFNVPEISAKQDVDLEFGAIEGSDDEKEGDVSYQDDFGDEF
jgi:hypothetical protein